MSEFIDTTFIMSSDTPKGKDPDQHSPTLRKYHSLLWSKPLPSGESFNLELDIPRLLHHKSSVGEFFLSSDCIGHTYRNTQSLKNIIKNISPNEIKSFLEVCGTIGGYIVFPSKKVNNKMTINGSRGCNYQIKDRFDLTLKCIKLFYENKDSPLKSTFDRYERFFKLFEDFKNYVDYFHLNPLVNKTYSEFNYFLPFKGFEYNPLPSNSEEYFSYKYKLTEFILSRNELIENWTKRSLH